MASFHRVRHRNGTFGDIVPCESDPCTLHGDDDIHADSLEDAYAMMYDDGRREGRSSSGARHPHPVMPKRRWGILKRGVVPLMAVTLVSSLAACGADRPYYDNTGASPQPRTSQTMPSPSPKHDAKAPDDADKAVGRARDYLEKARRKLEQATENGRIQGIPQPANGAHEGIPASLAANEGITKADLESLTVVPDHGRSGEYVRRQWSNGRFRPYGARSCWSVRDEVIRRQADPGTLRVTPDGCAVEAVSFTDPYSGRKISEHGKENVERNIQIDHVIPVSYMASNGGNGWDQMTKDEYFNDMDPGHLLAVESTENNLKSDSGPSTYMPTGGAAYRAAYAKDWVAILKSYRSKGVNATIERSDYDAIMRAFDETGVR